MSKIEISTQLLGVSEKRPEELAGRILSPKDINDAVRRVFELLGVDTEHDLRCVKTAVDREGHPKILVEVRYKAVKAKDGDAPTKSWTEFYEGDNGGGNKNRLARHIHDALQNCAYFGHIDNLKWKKVVRGDEKFAQIEFDPYIFVAFAWDINFADRLFKISAPAIRWTSSDALDEMSGKERKAVIRREQEYKEDNLQPCTFYATYANSSTWRLQDGTEVTGFHPSQVAYVYAETISKNKKKKNKKKD